MAAEVSFAISAEGLLHGSEHRLRASDLAHAKQAGRSCVLRWFCFREETGTPLPCLDYSCDQFTILQHTDFAIATEVERTHTKLASGRALGISQPVIPLTGRLSSRAQLGPVFYFTQYCFQSLTHRRSLKRQQELGAIALGSHV